MKFAKGLNPHILPYLVLNISLIYLFVALAFYLGLSPDLDIAFVSPDSHTYYQVGNWLYHGTSTQYLAFRPFLFPFVLFSSVNFIGIKAYFAFQFICWLGSANLLFATLTRLFNNKIISAVGALLLVSNLTYFMLTFHGLSEVLVIFLTTLFLFFLARWKDSKRKDKIMLSLLFILVLLTVTKPINFYFTILASLIVLPVLFYRYKYHKSIAKMVVVLLIYIPLFFQMGVMKVNYNTFNVSTIGSETFRCYLFRRCYAAENNLSWAVSLQQVREMQDTAVTSFILNHKTAFAETYFVNLKENIKAYSMPFLELKKDKITQAIIYGGKAGNYMIQLNSFYYYLHILFFFVIAFTVIKIVYKREFNYRNTCILILSFMLYSLLLTSAVSCDEGDRIVLPALPIWIVLYSMLLFPPDSDRFIKIKMFTKQLFSLR